jgi:hypothetical protein
MNDPDCLEGRGRTPEQMAADHRALQEVAPTAADKFALMFSNASETRATPECNREQFHRDNGHAREHSIVVSAPFARRLERQRDAWQELAASSELLRKKAELRHERVLAILAEVLDDWRGEWRPSESTSYQRAAALLQES